jgi:hypothetical protein
MLLKDAMRREGRLPLLPHQDLGSNRSFCYEVAGPLADKDIYLQG